MIFNIVYDVILLLLSLLALPKLAYQMIFHKKYRKSLQQRFGIGFPHIVKKGSRIVWVHAVSMGETRAVAPLVKVIKNTDPETLVFTSSVTETGFAEAEKSMPMADRHVFLPFDFNWIIAPIIKRVDPDIVILCETDFWYNFLLNCKKRKAEIYLVNGKISERSLKRFTKFPWFSNRLFSLIDHFCVQSSHYEKRFLSLGIPQNKIVVTGNIKFDGNFSLMPHQKLLEWRNHLGIAPNDYVLVAGSTHDPEESLLLATLQNVWKTIGNITLILVPRHPERFNEVANLLQSSKIPFRRFTTLADSVPKRDEKVILMDAIGLLMQCYQLADTAIVAGSYTQKVGGHNLIEPCRFGVPVIFGPHMHAQPELVELVLRYQAGLQVPPEHLDNVLIDLFQNKEKRRQLGEAGKKMTSELSGAVARTYQEIASKQKKLVKK